MSQPPAKKQKTGPTTDEDLSLHYYGSHFSRQIQPKGKIPEHGMPPRYAYRCIEDYHLLDYGERLNTSSYVNVVFEPEEKEVAYMGLKINLADQTVYPSSFKMHNEVVNMLANLWNCPKPAVGDEYAGAGTVGSTEACLLAGLALKFRWRHWYAKKHGMTEGQVRGVYPNVVMSSAYQAAWEKFFKYMDVEPILVKPKHAEMSVGAELAQYCNEKTIAVIGIMGNHYGGQYDKIWDIDAAITKLNKEKGWQIGIHVDGASGAFIAPFQKYLKPWDFRCKNVLSISASGHKFGQSACGTGWIVWRHREQLSEHVAISVSYLGGQGDSYTLNFSRPATGVFVQFYKLMRLGLHGYQELEINMMSNAKVIRDGLKAMKFKGKPRFIMLDDGDEGCLPVVTAMLNPELGLGYDDVALQYAIAESHWYVSAYKMKFGHPITEEEEPLFSDAPATQTMFRVVVKSNLTALLAVSLLESIGHALEFLDANNAYKTKAMIQRQTNHCPKHC